MNVYLNEGGDQVALDTFTLIEKALQAESLEDLSNEVFPRLLEFTRAGTSFLYLSDLRFAAPHCAILGLNQERSRLLQQACPMWFDRIVHQPQVLSEVLEMPDRPPSNLRFTIWPILIEQRVVGMLGVSESEDTSSAQSDLLTRLLAVLGLVVDKLGAKASTERRLRHLNTYLTVSSMLTLSIDLEELLEIALHSCMEAISADAASILLLDDEKENFNFYRVEGAAKPLLASLSFPVTEGVAGRVMQTLEGEIVNDVDSDPRFYEMIDLQTGYHTRNLIAVPLVAGDERVGVLEVLNKTGGDSFSADERMLLGSLADEIALAVRNATVFDYLVGTYCKRRQGHASCKGCLRPLGSWTPCVRYREFLP
ncbi:GAF domain-containing protein [Candidatus Bipolaricaulota bacterium]